MAQPQQSRILIVEDEKHIAAKYRRALKDIGETRTAERLDQVLEQILDFDPHVIALDIVLEEDIVLIVLEEEEVKSPWEAGIRILDRIKKLRPPFQEIPVIVVTARTDTEAESRCRELGAVAFLRKPVSAETLPQAVRSALKERSRLSQRLKVFISSTMQELEAERWVVKQATEELGPQYNPVVAEVCRARPESPREVCQRAVTECDLFVLLLGEKYGTPIVAGGISPTEDEYNTAREAGKPILVFVKDVPPREPRLEAFLARVADFVEGHWVKHFSNHNRLRVEVKRAVGAYGIPGSLA